MQLLFFETCGFDAVYAFDMSKELEAFECFEFVCEWTANGFWA
jgi:hypothetical protein